jgi:hypothetical protein
LHGTIGKHQHHEFDMIQRLGNLQPEVASAFKADNVLPEREAQILQLLAEISGKVETILARIGEACPLSHRHCCFRLLASQ